MTEIDKMVARLCYQLALLDIELTKARQEILKLQELLKDK